MKSERSDIHYDSKSGLPMDRQYLEQGLPPFLQESLDAMKASWARIDRGERDNLWDCYYCELQSSINMAEVENMIDESQAWYLREKYLRMERPDTAL